MRQETGIQRAQNRAKWLGRGWAGVLVACVAGLPWIQAGVQPTPTYEEKVVAAVLMGEAWCQGRKGMLAVGEVIHQRSVRLQRTPLQVVTTGAKGIHAFSCLNGTTPAALVRKFEKEPMYAVALEVATTICRDPETLPGLTSGATHFSLAAERPRRARGQKPVAVIGAHAFYRLRWI